VPNALQTCEMPELRIIDEETWQKVQSRLSLAPRAGKKGFSNDVSRNVDHPKYILCGSMKCAQCGGAINLIGGKPPGYYGCQMNQRNRCKNNRTINRLKLEDAVISELKRQILNEQSVKVILQGMEEEFREQTKYLPEEVTSKNRELEQLQGKEKNLVKFLAEGICNDAIRNGLKSIEERQQVLREQIACLKTAQLRLPKLPSGDEIPGKLEDLMSILEVNVGETARLIKSLVGEAMLEVKVDEKGKEYLDYSTVVRAIALAPFFSDDGSNPFEMWRCRESNPGPRSVNPNPLHAYQMILISLHALLTCGIAYS